VPLRQKPLAKVRADEARPAGHKNPHLFSSLKKF
jgi:hypothetical protein